MSTPIPPAHPGEPVPQRTGSAPTPASAPVADLARRLHEAVSTVVQGKDDVVSTALVVLLAGGHLLLEDVPGVGKTTLAKALSAALGAPMRRIQFTPDLLPSDITGVNVFDARRGEFEFRPGAIFASIVVCDEINRASPKTQSAVLEAMEEAQVTVDGTTRPLPAPFLVVATQNPLEMEGTYPLPEAQRDRFMARLSLGYPAPEAEAAMLEDRGDGDPLAQLRPVADLDELAAAAQAVRGVYASAALRAYLVDLVGATRRSPQLRLGASPRATLHLLRAAQARAAIAGRDHVLPEDVTALVGPLLGHRVLLSGEARMARATTAQALAGVVAGVPLRAHPSPSPGPATR